MDKERYRLEKVNELSQTIWDDLFNKELIRFSENDYSGEFTLITPELITRFLNRDKTLDIYDASAIILSMIDKWKKNEKVYDEMRECIEGLKEGGTALNFCMPKPHVDLEDCVTTSELYRIQYKMAKKKWEGYYSRFYLKRPSENDEVVNRQFRSDLHHMRFFDGRWHFRCIVNGVTVKRFLSNDEEEAKIMRDNLMKELGFK